MRFGGPVPALQISIPSGRAGVKATLALMVKLVSQYKAHPLIRERARALVQGCPERDYDCEIEALQSFVRDEVRYTNDVAGVETLQSPVVTLGYREPAYGQYESGGTASGDCDDKSVLLASLLQAIGIPGAFCAVQTAETDGIYSHVLVEARLRRRTGVEYVPLETIVPEAGPGWFPPDATCFMLAHFG